MTLLIAGVQFNNAALTNVSNACTRAVMASADATVNNGRSAVISSNASTASGIGATIIAANGATLDGEHTAVIAAQNVTVDGDYGITTGTGSTVVGNRNLIGGLGNTISADRTVAWGNTLMADGAENGALFGSANTDEGLNNLTSGASNTNTGTGTLLTGNGNSNTGFANLVGGNINDNAGDRGLVTGGGNTIESGAIANTVANGQNTIRAGSVGCNAWGRGNEVTAPLYANVYGQYTIAPGSDTTVWGYAGAAPAATSNRSVEIDQPTGNITTTGTLTTSAVFAGIGEKAIVDKKLPEGSLVVFEGLAGVREAKEGELPDGVTTKALVMSIGGGIDPDNAPWLLDSMGNKLFEEIEVVEEFETVDKDATEKLKEKAREAYEKTLAKAESDEDKAAVVLEEVVALFKKVSKKSKVNQTVKNPKYDPTKLVETENVEMLGRQWAINPNGLKVGEHMTGGHIAGRGFRVLAVKDDMALLLVGCSVGGEAA